jgi:hypothetical protein
VLTREQRDQIATAATKALMDEGRIIEAGWIGLKIMAVPEDAPQVQIDEMRSAFFAGAQHLFASIMTGLDPDAEPTEADMKRLDLIDAELKRFIAEYQTKIPTQGSA